MMFLEIEAVLGFESLRITRGQTTPSFHQNAEDIFVMENADPSRHVATRP